MPATTLALLLSNMVLLNIGESGLVAAGDRTTASGRGLEVVEATGCSSPLSSEIDRA